MNIDHINVKFFIENPESVNLESYHKIFNSWIQTHRTEEMLVDVADYLHVHHGPGLMLIGHEADYSLDNRAGRLGLLYNRKAPLDGSTQDKLNQAARAVLTTATILEKENGLKFNGQEVQIVINDRLIAPNTIQTFTELEPELRTFFDKLFSGATYTLEHVSDSRERFTVNVKTAAAFNVQTLLQTLPAKIADKVETAHA
jgi:hypothetical protein